MEPSSFKDRLVWTLVSAASTAAAVFFAERIADRAWRYATGREPPRSYSIIAPAGRSAGRATAAHVAKWSRAWAH